MNITNYQRYSYLTVPVDDCMAMFTPHDDRPDAYITRDKEGCITALENAIKSGYRWVRTDGDMAVWEKDHGERKETTT